MPSNIHIWGASEWPTSVAESMTPPVHSTSQLSKKSMGSLTGVSTPSCTVPAMNGKQTSSHGEIRAQVSISETNWPSAWNGSGFSVNQLSR